MDGCLGWAHSRLAVWIQILCILCLVEAQRSQSQESILLTELWDTLDCRQLADRVSSCGSSLSSTCEVLRREHDKRCLGADETALAPLHDALLGLSEGDDSAFSGRNATYPEISTDLPTEPGSVGNVTADANGRTPADRRPSSSGTALCHVVLGSHRHLLSLQMARILTILVDRRSTQIVKPTTKTMVTSWRWG